MPRPIKKINSKLIEVPFSRNISSSEIKHKIIKLSSPINRVSEMRVPFFLLHGKKDIRTPYKDAELFMQEMDRNNISYEKMIITKEEHGFSNEENREASMERLLKFFNKYL